MGRKKKKPFIDKKHAQTFRLVPRSQQDPLYGDGQAAQHVLQPSAEPQDRVAEQQKYGIFYSDDYDYLQHLREPGSAFLEQAPPTSATPTRRVVDSGRPELPAELFASEVKVEGKLEKVLPIAGPRPDWDPDIVAALEGDSEMFEDTEQLDDDFILQANGGEPGIPVYVTEHHQDNEELGPAPSWWEARGDFTAPEGGEPRRSKVDCDQSDDSSTREGKSAGLTKFSMTSSVVPRSEALTLLDDRFEQFLETYDDSEIGPGAGEEEEEPTFDPTTSLLLQHALEDFERNFSTSETKNALGSPMCEGGEGGEGGEDGGGSDTSEDGDTSEGGDSGEGGEDGDASEGGDSGEGGEGSDTSEGGDSGEGVRLVEVVEAPKEKWDCESILSTYSTLYNHPTRISEPRLPSSSSSSSSPARGDGSHGRGEGGGGGGGAVKIKLSRKTGLPLDTLPGPAPKERTPKKMPMTRPRDESREDKKARKESTRQERKLRRADKKATKMAFKSEELRQEKALRGNYTHTVSVV